MARAATTSDAFNAIAEPQCRDILDVLRAGDRASLELVGGLGIAHPSVSKRLKVLREVHLVHVLDAGRRRIYGLDARGLQPVHEWAGGFEELWNERFDSLNAYMQELKRGAPR